MLVFACNVSLMHPSIGDGNKIKETIIASEIK